MEEDNGHCKKQKRERKLSSDLFFTSDIVLRIHVFVSKCVLIGNSEIKRC